MATPQKFQMSCSFKAFRPFRTWDCILTGHSEFWFYFYPYLKTHMFASHVASYLLWKYQMITIHKFWERLTLWPGQFEHWATGIDFWTSSNVSVWCPKHFCLRVRSVLIFSRSLNVSLIKASWCSLNTWILSSCKFTCLKSMDENSSLEDISKGRYSSHEKYIKDFL